MKFYTVCLILSLHVCNVFGAKILGVFPMCAHSHYTVGYRLMEGLSQRGHQVTFISCYPEKAAVKNMRNLLAQGVKDALAGHKFDLEEDEDRHFFKLISKVNMLGCLILDKTLSSPEVLSLIKSKETFDVVLMEEFAAPGLVGFAKHFAAHNIIVNSVRPNFWNNFYFGNPEEPAYIPHIGAKFNAPLNFYQRILNIFYLVCEYLNRHLIMLPKQNEILHKHLPNLPHLHDMLYNQSLMLTNTHVSFDYNIPKLPNMIEIGGYHVAQPKPLPKDLEEFLNNSPEGVIYFSLGSNLQSKDMSPEKLDAILKSFAKIKQRVIWKLEVDSLPNQPKNLFIGKWFPQNDILAHPNVRAFISHGGLLGSIEAIHHGVPIIGIPFFGDQRSNILRIVSRGYGLAVYYSELNEEKFSNALHEILNNKTYTENIKQGSKLMNDRIETPMDTAIYWIEYVIKNGGAHFRSAALDLKWYQRTMLDVTFTIFAICFGIIFIIRKFLCRGKPEASRSRKEKLN